MAANQQTNIEPLLLSAVEAARLLGVSRSKFYSMHAAGLVPLPVFLGGCVRWPVDELRAWVKAGCVSREQWQAMKRQSYE